MYIEPAVIGLMVFSAGITYIIHEAFLAARNYLEEKGWIV